MRQWNTIKGNQSNRPEYKKKENWDILEVIQHYVIKFVSTGQWFSPGAMVSSNNKIDHHKILLKVALNTITLTLIIGSLFWSHFFTGFRRIS
jgi:hypothetical protein